MAKEEIALQLTLKAMDTGNISKTGAGSSTPNAYKESENKFAAEQIAKFYNTIYLNLSTEISK